MIQKLLHQNTLILLVLLPSVRKIFRAKIVFKLVSVSVRNIVFLTFILIVINTFNTRGNSLFSNHQDTIANQDSVKVLTSAAQPSEKQSTDSLVRSDTTGITEKHATDSLAVKPTRKDQLEDKVTYSSVDSMRVDVQEQKLFLYRDAQVNYTNLELKAYYIELDLANEEIFAKGWPDTAGTIVGKPVFTQGNQSFTSDSIRYNFHTKSGIIYHIVTQEGEGYLHSERTKRHPNEHIHIENGKYTTCDAEHPHFYLALTKGIVIPDDKIITGPAYMVILDIPIKFLAIPFGFFPNTTTRASGILIPSYGEERTRGFYLRDFGWYQTLGDYADFRIQGDAYTKGSWAVRNTLSYKWRYHFSGNFAFNYAVTDNNDDLFYAAKKDYALRWTHRQDPKANPTQNFSASVNFASSDYDRNFSYNSNDYLNTSTNSSISYTKRWPNTPFNLSLSANASQNKQTRTVGLSLPTGSFNMSSIYPFRSKNGSGKYKWYENISLTYSSSFKNELDTYDSLMFKQETWNDMRNGFQHSIPLAVNLKIGKLITITPSMNYTGVFYSRHIEINNMVEYDSLTGDYIIDTTEYRGLKYEQAFNPSLGISFTPKLYGMLISTKEDSYIEAIRHVLSPSASFSFTPDMNKINRVDYYDTLYYINEDNEQEVYDIYNWYEEELYSPPSSNGKSGSLRLALNNNLEMKVRPRNDTTGESKKVVLLDNLNFTTSYNPFRDTLRWEDVSMITGTKLFNNKVDIRVNGRFSPYALDSAGRKINEFYISQHKDKILRFVSLSVNTSFTLRSGQGTGKKSEETQEETSQEENVVYDEYYMEDDMYVAPLGEMSSYVDFNIPWSLNVRHSYSISKTAAGKSNISNTLNLSGDISLTQKWKIGGQMNYDLELKKISYTTLSVYRDLHCWEMRFSVVPFGPRTSYSFTIQAKGSLLRDLKYEKKTHWFDNF
jgi:lipopolysaccharide assembly outer membrane protein LptD (OstA)